MSKSPMGRWLGLIVAAILVALIWHARQEPATVAPQAKTFVGATAVASRASVVNGATDQAKSAAASVASPQPGRKLLFTYAQPANAAELDAALPAPTPAIRYVRLNAALIAGKQSPFWQPAGRGRLELPLAEGSSLAVVIDASEMLGADRFTSTGHLEGRPLS